MENISQLITKYDNIDDLNIEEKDIQILIEVGKSLLQSNIYNLIFC